MMKMADPKELRDLFERKVAMFRELKGNASSTSEDISRKVLSTIRNIIDLNRNLLSLQAPEKKEMVRGKEYFDKMIEIVRGEQHFLENYFERSLEEAIRARNFNEYWLRNIARYQKLIEIIRLDLTYFSILLDAYATDVVYGILQFIQRGNINGALDYLEEKGSEILSKEEQDFFVKLLRGKDPDEINRILRHGQELLDRQDYEKFSKEIPVEREGFQLLLQLLPINIEIMSINSQTKPFDKIEIKAGTPMSITARVRCSSIPTKCKAILELGEWSAESQVEVIDAKNRVGALNYQKEIEFEVDANELKQTVKEPSSLRLVVEAQNALNKETADASIDVVPDYEAHLVGMDDLLRQAGQRGPGRRWRKRFPIE